MASDVTEDDVGNTPFVDLELSYLGDNRLPLAQLTVDGDASARTLIHSSKGSERDGLPSEDNCLRHRLLDGLNDLSSEDARQQDSAKAVNCSGRPTDLGQSFFRHSGGTRRSTVDTEEETDGAARSTACAVGCSEEVLTLSRNCYTLILVSGKANVLLPMVAVAAGQFGVLWLVAWSSAEYVFESGQWIVPVSNYWPVNSMKVLSLIVSLFRITTEFSDASKIFRALLHQHLVPMPPRQCLLGWCAFLLQYAVAVGVLFMATHLILASATAITTIGKLWVVFTVLDFDNFFCNFILYVFDAEESFEWKIHLHGARQGRKSWMLLYWVPVALALLGTVASVSANVCPLTALHYGAVSNNDPVMMLSGNLGIPSGCCPPQVAWSGGLDGLVNVSVPCLAPAGKHGHASSLPRLHYVVLEDGRPQPSSLQVLDGRGGDGNHGLLRGSIAATPLQMRFWLTSHGFKDDIYNAMMGKGAGGLGLYSSSFPFVGEWTIPGFPVHARARVHVVAVNPSTGALSPVPVQSSVIVPDICSPHCSRCSQDGDCRQCEQGFTLDGLQRRCLACSAACDSCDHAGAGRCDRGGCRAGHGLSLRGTCLPCAGVQCHECDEAPPGNSSKTPVDLPHDQLACVSCESGHGLSPNTSSCIPCEVEKCGLCGDPQHCDQCQSGYIATGTRATTTTPPPPTNNTHTANNDKSSSSQRCLPCAAHCSSCKLLGHGFCDPERCHLGYSLTPTGLCANCSRHCLNCTISGPGHCDAGYCMEGYGLQGGAECSRCQEVAHCDRCDAAPDRCDGCLLGFFLTPQHTCEVCVESCRRCASINDCAECNEGFGLQNGRCQACADHCQRCDVAGPGQCDAGGCLPGWTTQGVSGSSVCIPSPKKA